MARLRYDNSLGTISDNPLAAGATTINFNSAPSWATLAAGDYIPLVLEPPSGSSPSANFEIVYVTAYAAGAGVGEGVGETPRPIHLVLFRVLSSVP